MAKKTKKAKRSAKGGGGTTFSLVAMHNQLAKVLKRLEKVKSPKAYTLQAKVKAFQKATDCGQTMLPEL